MVREMTSVGRTLCVIAVVSLVLLINLGVIMSLFGIGALVEFGEDIFFLGQAVSLNTITDLQWHIFALVLLLAMGPLILLNLHVRVDFLVEKMCCRTRCLIEIICHLLFGLPFAVFLLPPLWSFFQRSWRIDESGINGGLQDIYAIKFMMILGFALLLLSLCLRLIIDLRSFRRTE